MRQIGRIKRWCLIPHRYEQGLAPLAEVHLVLVDLKFPEFSLSSSKQSAVCRAAAFCECLECLQAPAYPRSWTDLTLRKNGGKTAVVGPLMMGLLEITPEESQQSNEAGATAHMKPPATHIAHVAHVAHGAKARQDQGPFMLQESSMCISAGAA